MLFTYMSGFFSVNPENVTLLSNCLKLDLLKWFYLKAEGLKYITGSKNLTTVSQIFN